MSRARDLLAVLLLLSAPVVARAQGTPAATPSAPTVETGSTVKLEYTLKDDAGTVLDSNKGQEPLSYTQGGQQLIPGLEKQLIGMHVGEEKKVVLKPEEAYGQNDPAAQAAVLRRRLAFLDYRRFLALRRAQTSKRAAEAPSRKRTDELGSGTVTPGDEGVEPLPAASTRPKLVRQAT